MPEPVLETFSLCKSFDGFAAVTDVNLKVKPGEIVGLLGPNGAGKSTTLKLLSTLIRPTSGTARIAGYDILQSPTSIRQHIGIIFQDSTLDNRLTGRENLEFHCWFYHVPKKERQERIRRVLAMVELTDVADRIIKLYSGGMKRRLEIARGLLHRPTVLFLDEPTVGLDPQTRSTIWTYINRLVEDYAMGVLMTTHYMEEAENCDFIAIMDHGSIIAEGSPTKLKSKVMDGDEITLEVEASDIQAVQTWLQSAYSLQAGATVNGVVFTLPDAERKLARLLAEIPYPISRFVMRKPSMEDVFLQLTGRQIREEEASSRDRLRLSGKRRGKF